MELSDILEVTDDLATPRWVECAELPGFAILLRLPDVPGLRGLAMAAAHEAVEKAKEEMAAAGDGGRHIEVDPGAIGVKWAQYAVLDWRGLTGAGLRWLLAGVPGLKIKVAEETVIPFWAEVFNLLLRRSGRFYEFVDQAWKNMESRILKDQEGDEKNSLSAPDTTLTPPPGSVPGASKKRKNSGKSRRAGAAGARPGIPQTS